MASLLRFRQGRKKEIGLGVAAMMQWSGYHDGLAKKEDMMEN